jgi:hypothetical protein
MACVPFSVIGQNESIMYNVISKEKRFIKVRKKKMFTSKFIGMSVVELVPSTSDLYYPKREKKFDGTKFIKMIFLN